MKTRAVYPTMDHTAGFSYCFLHQASRLRKKNNQEATRLPPLPEVRAGNNLNFIFKFIGFRKGGASMEGDTTYVFA